MDPPCESLSMMDPPLTLIVRDGCFELSYKWEYV